jgi:hypothetical protein
MFGSQEISKETERKIDTTKKKKHFDKEAEQQKFAIILHLPR